MVLLLTAKRIDVSMDVPGDKQSFNFSETSAKFQTNNSFAPVNGGANNLIIQESKNSYNGGFRWKHATAYNASPTASPGTYKLFRFVNGGSETETEIFSIDGSGNVTFDNDVTVNGTFAPSILTIPATIDVSGTTQTFQYSGNHLSKFVLKNLYAATLGNPSTVELDFINSTTGGYKFIHTSSTTDSAGLGVLELKIINHVGASLPVFTCSVDGAVPGFTVNGNAYFSGINTFNQGAIGTTVFDANVTFNLNAILATAPTLGSHLTNKTYVDSVAGNVSSLINVSGSSQTFSFAGGTQADQFIIKNTYTPTSGFASSNSLVLKNVHNAGYELKQSTVDSLYDDIGIVYFSMFNPSLSINKVIWSVIPTGSGTSIMSFGQDVDIQFASEDIQFTEPTGSFQCAPAAEFLGTVIVPPPTLGTHATNKTYVDSVAGGLSNPLSLADSLTFNWSYAASSNPSAYQFLNTFTDSQQDKKYRYRVLTTDTSAGREWSVDYTLIGNSDLNGVYEIKYGSSPLSTFTPFKIEVYPFANTYITIDGQLNLNSHRIIGVSDPINPQDVVTKAYAHSLNAITLSGSSTATFSIKNSLAATGGSPSYLRFDLLNSTTGGFRFLHTSTNTDPAGLGTLKIQALNNVGATADAMTLSLSGGGVPDVAFGGSATFNGPVTFSGYPVKASVNLAAYDFVLDNTHSSGVTQFVISNVTTALKIGYSNSANLSYIDNIAQPFQIRMNGTSCLHMATNGSVGINTTTPTQAKLVISGGVANVASEDSCIRVTGSSNSTKIELGNTSASGKLYELGSNNAGAFVITDRTGTTARLTINTSGNTILSGNLALNGASANSPLQFANSNANRKIVLSETANNDHQILSFGTNSGILRFQVDATATDFVFYAATSSSASNEVFRIKGDGTVGIGISTPHAPLHFASSTANRKIVLYEGTNNDHQFYGFGVNSSILRFQLDQTASDFVFYAATSSSASNEVFRIKGSGGIVLPTSGGTPATLSYYETGTISISFTGPASIGPITAYFQRVGNRVTFSLQNVAQPTSTSATFFVSSAGVIPSRLRPVYDVDEPIWVMDNGSWQSNPGRIHITTGGTINIYKAFLNTNFTGSGACGLGNKWLTWLIA